MFIGVTVGGFGCFAADIPTIIVLDILAIRLLITCPRSHMIVRMPPYPVPLRATDKPPLI